MKITIGEMIKAEGEPSEVALFAAFFIDALKNVTEEREIWNKEKEASKEATSDDEPFDPMEFLDTLIIKTFGDHSNGGEDRK